MRLIITTLYIVLHLPNQPAMKTRANEILIMYDAASTKARQTLALVHTLSQHVQEWDFSNKPLTATQWKALLDQLDLEPKQLLDKSIPYYQEHIRGREFDDEGWLNVIRRNTHLIMGPIVVHGNRAVLCKTPTAVFSVVRELEDKVVLIKGLETDPIAFQ